MANWCNVKLQGKLKWRGLLLSRFGVWVWSQAIVITNTYGGMNTKNERPNGGCVFVCWLDDSNSRGVRWMTDGRGAKTFSQGGLKRIEFEDKDEDVDGEPWKHTE